MTDARAGERSALTARCDGELREGRSLRALVEQDLDDDLRAAVGRLGLVVLRPDSLAAGLGVALLERLEAEHGAVPVALRVRVLPPSLVDALYARQDKIPRDSLWLHHAVFASGPSAAILLAGPPGRDLTARLYAAKGASSPVATGDGPTLRAAFRRTSSFHAVLHAPEGTEAFLVESTLLFPWAEVREAAARAAGSREAPPGLPGEAWRELVVLEPRPDRLVFQAMLKVKRRIAAALLVRRDVLPGPIRLLWDLMAAADRALEGESYTGQRRVFLAFAEAERDPLRAAIEATRSGLVARLAGPPAGAPGREGEWRGLRTATAPLALLYASWFLSGQEPLGAEGPAQVLATLEAHDVPLSPAQASLVGAALRADLNPAATMLGTRLYPLSAWTPR
jgi:hypothetical protein